MKPLKYTWATSAKAILLIFGLSGCANTSHNADPFEHTNRLTFRLNEKLDAHFARPVAVFYNRAIPQFARDGIHNFISNIDSPVILANDVLQANPAAAGTTLGRIAINSTVGVGGLVDVATKVGLERHSADFGQTLGIYGVASGPYLMLPLLGPSNARDFTGTVTDVFQNPLTYASWPGSTYYKLGLDGMAVLDYRARNVEISDQVQHTSVDHYATVRSLYQQSRQSKIQHGAIDDSGLPDF